MMIKGNTALRENRLSDAMECYLRAICGIPDLSDVICANIRYAGMLNRRLQGAQSWQVCLGAEGLAVTAQPETGAASDHAQDDQQPVSTLIAVSQLSADAWIYRLMTQPVARLTVQTPDLASLLYGLSALLVWQADVRVRIKGGADHEVDLLQYLREQTGFAMQAALALGLHESVIALLKGVRRLVDEQRLTVTTDIDRQSQPHQQLFLAFRQWLADCPLSTVIPRLFRLLLGRDPQAHETRHYGGMLERKETTAFELARVIGFSEEGMRFLNGNGAPLLDDLGLDTRLQTLVHAVPPEAIRLPVADQPVVSVVIPVYGKVEYTLMCLSSIARHWPTVPIEIIVLDDCSTDDSVQVLKRVNNIRLIENEKNLGFLRSCNAGVAQARGQYVFLLNNDTRVTAGWLDSQYDLMRSDASIGLVGAKLVYPDGTLQEAGGIVWDDASAWNYGRGKNPADSAFNYIKDVDYCSGAAILFERAQFAAFGGFDDRYAPAYYEDTDLAFLMRQAGKRVVFQPASVVIHYEGISHGKHTDSGLKAYQVENRRKFFDKWQAVLTREHHPNAQRVFRARERAGRRKIMLMVDHQLPQPDRDAGSKSMWHIIRTFQSQGWVIKFWPHNHYYHPQYADWLQKAGIEVLAGDRYVGHWDTWMQDHAAELDAVFLSRPGVAVNYLTSLQQHPQLPVLYYGHDIHYVRLQRQLEIQDSPSVRAEMESFRRYEHQIWRRLPVLFYPSDEEEKYVSDWLRSQGLKKTVCKTIPLYAWEQGSEFEPPPAHKRRDIAFVAGFAHPPNIDAAQWFVREVLPLVRARLPDIRLHLVGSNPTPDILALQSDCVNVTGFVSDERLAEIYGEVRGIVAPLRFGGGMKGKILESLYFGVPCVTTSTGLQGLSGAGGFMSACDEPRQMADALIELHRDDASWQERSAAGQRFIAENFSQTALWRVLSAHLQTSKKSD